MPRIVAVGKTFIAAVESAEQGRSKTEVAYFHVGDDVGRKAEQHPAEYAWDIWAWAKSAGE